MTGEAAFYLASAIIVCAMAGCTYGARHDDNELERAKYQAITAGHYTAHETSCLINPPWKGSSCDDVERKP